jgi:hypothetical protein
MLAVMSVLWRVVLHGCTVPLVAVTAAAGWLWGFDRWYVIDEDATLRNLWIRCKDTAVKEEIPNWLAR